MKTKRSLAIISSPETACYDVGGVHSFCWVVGGTRFGASVCRIYRDLVHRAGRWCLGCMNMQEDVDIDAVMRRTKKRPIPGKVTADEAKAFGIALSGISVVMLGLATNWYAAGLLAFMIFFYVVIYTMWLKRWTSQNIVTAVRRAHSLR